MMSNRRKSFFLGVVVALAAWFGVPSGQVLAQTSEEIRSMSSDIVVRQDGVIQVTEQIEYFFPSPKRCIYRDIPLAYRNDKGERYTIPVRVLGVTKPDGSPWTYRTMKQGTGLRIQIGDADATISGIQTYVIKYEASGALRYFADHDEFYWNATGNAWIVPIARSSARVRLPDSVPADGLTVKCYTGASGSTAENCMANFQGRTADFAANGMLTVVVGWKPGLVAKLYPEKPWFGWPYLPYILPVVAAVVMYRRWSTKGRDPKGRRTVMVQYEPLAGFGPADCDTVIKQTTHAADISSVIVDLAVRGYLKIREIEEKVLLFTAKDFELTSLKPWNDPQLKPYEQAVLDAIFGGGGSVVNVSHLNTTHAFYGKIDKIKRQMQDFLVVGGYVDKNPEGIRGGYFLLATLVLVAGIILTTNFFDSVGAGGVGTYAAWIATAVIIAAFGWFMPRRTEAGVVAYEYTLGFRDFIQTAEKYRIQWQEKENVFEELLPYAMAFGIVDKWAKAFEGMTIPQPNWYEGRAFTAGAFNAAAFQNAFSSFNNSLNSAAMSQPQSSSSGSGFSGGHSGGGGGGGGGGSW